MAVKFVSESANVKDCVHYILSGKEAKLISKSLLAKSVKEKNIISKQRMQLWSKSRQIRKKLWGI